MHGVDPLWMGDQNHLKNCCSNARFQVVYLPRSTNDIRMGYLYLLFWQMFAGHVWVCLKIRPTQKTTIFYENGWWWFRVFPKCSVKIKKTCHDRPSITHHYIHYIHCHCQLLITHRPVTRSSSIFFQACQMAPVSHGSRCQRCPKTLIVLCIFLFINDQILLYHAISQYRQKKNADTYIILSEQYVYIWILYIHHNRI